MYVLAARLALGHLRQQFFARVFVVFSLATVLVVGAVLLQLHLGFTETLRELGDSKFATLYLDRMVNEQSESEVLSAVKKIPGVNDATLVSKEVFLENFSKYFPQLANDVAVLEVDTIPRFIKVRMSSDLDAQVVNRFEKLNGIESVEVNAARFKSLSQAVFSLRRFVAVLIVGVVLALLTILINHFKLGSSFQGQVRLAFDALGARVRHTMLPFVIIGAVEGGVGGVIACVSLVFGQALVESKLNGFFIGIGYHPIHLNFTLAALGVVAIGMLSGIFGSVWAVVRFKRA